MNANPGKGFRRTTARLAGTGNVACNSPAFDDSSDVNCTVASRPSSADSDNPTRSAKLLLTISSMGSWVRLMRCAVKS